MNITVAGVGYVGLAQAVLLAQHNAVTAVTTTPAKAENINRGVSPIVDAEITDFLRTKPLTLTATVDAEQAYRTADVVIIATPTDYSFPSGHTLSSTIAATILAKTDRRFGYAAISLAVLIALSRLYLYVHFPSDVFAAALLGLLIGELMFRYGGKLLDKISRRQKE